MASHPVPMHGSDKAGGRLHGASPDTLVEYCEAPLPPGELYPAESRRRAALRAIGSGLALALAVGAAGCSTADAQDSSEDVVVAAVLPFTGSDSTIGFNLEQALVMAVEDVNAARGRERPKLRLRLGDSGSGSTRGLDSLLSALYRDEVRYVVGPEENELADEITSDIKALDVFNILPGFASPKIQRVSRKGAWMALAPSHFAWGCGLAELAARQGVASSNSIIARDDFSQDVATEFASEYNALGGRVMAWATVSSGATSYQSTQRALSAGADRTLLFVDPTTASTIITEWAVGVRVGNWLLGPNLNTPGFLMNVPFGALDGAYGLSPTLSLASECQETRARYHGSIECRRDNAEAFRAYFAQRWDGDEPFPAAYFYYDAIVLLAMGLDYAAAHGKEAPSAKELHSAILEMTETATSRRRWDDLSSVFAEASEGTPVSYVGAAAEYQFDRWGAAIHPNFDSWRVKGLAYIAEETLRVRCAPELGTR